MNGLFAKGAMTELRSRQGVCTGTCSTYHCASDPSHRSRLARLSAAANPADRPRFTLACHFLLCPCSHVRASFGDVFCSGYKGERLCLLSS